MADKTSIFIDKLSPQGKDAMYKFLHFQSTGKLGDATYQLSKSDTQNLSVIVGRLKLQHSVEKVNSLIKEFNKKTKTNLTLISE